jgi:hypothetical protein
MNIEKLNALIATTQPNKGEKGHLFTISFIKKDGTPRTMRARLGMQRNLTGKGMSFNPATKGLLPVWSADSQGYRMVNLNTVTELKIGNQTFNQG